MGGPGSGSRRLLDLRRLARHPITQNAAALYGVQAALYLLPLVTLPYLARVLGPQGLGRAVFVQSFSFVLALIIEYGFIASATRAVSTARDDPAALARIVAGVLGAKTALIAFATTVALLALALVPSFRSHPDLLGFAWALGVCQGLFPVWYFLGVERVKVLGVIDVGVRLAGAVGMLLFVRGPQDIRVLLAIWTLQAFVSSGVLNLLLYRSVPFRRPRRPEIAESLKRGRTLFVATSAVTLYTSANVFLLGLVLPAAQVGIFAAGERIVRAAGRLTTPIAAATFPRATFLIDRGREARAQRLATLTLLALFGIGCAGSLLLAVLATPITKLLFGPGYGESAAVMRVLGLLLPLIGISGAIAQAWLIPRGLDRQAGGIVVVAGVLNVILVPLLAPSVGVLGIAALLVALESMIVIVYIATISRAGMLPRWAQLTRG